MSASTLRAAVAFAGLAVWTAGCGTMRQPERIEFRDHESWLSQTRADVVAIFGDPSSTARDSAGREILVYAELKRVPSGIYPDFRGGFANPVPFAGDSPSSARRRGQGPQSFTPPPAGIDERALAAFTLDREGRVEESWFSERMWRRGVPSPPRRLPSEISD